MTWAHTFQPTSQIHDGIVTQLQALPNITKVIPTNRIKTRWDNRGDVSSTGVLTATNILVWAEDLGEDIGAIGPTMLSFRLNVAVLCAHDMPSSEFTASTITTPHEQHESICGEVWYAFFRELIAAPTVTDLAFSGNASHLIYEGAGSGGDDTGWFMDVYTFRLDYSNNYTPTPSTTT